MIAPGRLQIDLSTTSDSGQNSGDAIGWGTTALGAQRVEPQAKWDCLFLSLAPEAPGDLAGDGRCLLHMPADARRKTQDATQPSKTRRRASGESTRGKREKPAGPCSLRLWRASGGLWLSVAIGLAALL